MSAPKLCCLVYNRIKFKLKHIYDGTLLGEILAYEPRHEKTKVLHMRKQRHRSASR